MELVDGNIVSNEAMENEAIERMKHLKMLDSTIESFKQGKLQVSDQNGTLIDLGDDLKKFISEHEKEIGSKFFHVIHTFSNLGETYECLFVSNYLEDWDYERDLLKRNIVYCYAINKTFPENSEAGSIVVKNNNGGLVRIA